MKVYFCFVYEAMYGYVCEANMSILTFYDVCLFIWSYESTVCIRNSSVELIHVP